MIRCSIPLPRRQRAVVGPGQSPKTAWYEYAFTRLSESGSSGTYHAWKHGCKYRLEQPWVGISERVALLTTVSRSCESVCRWRSSNNGDSISRLNGREREPFRSSDPYTSQLSTPFICATNAELSDRANIGLRRRGYFGPSDQSRCFILILIRSIFLAGNTIRRCPSLFDISHH